MSRSYDEVMEFLDDRADYELVVSSSRVEVDDEELYLGLVTVDGTTRGVVTREGQLSALENAAQLAVLGEEVSSVQLLRATLEELGFDRTVALLEQVRS